MVVGRETGRLTAQPPRPVFDLEEAVDWVAAHLPPDVTAQLSHDDVRQIMRWNLDYFRTRGVSSNGSTAVAPSSDVVVGGAETVDFALGQAESTGIEVTAAQVHAVLDAQMAYLQAIGAVGPAGGEPGSPERGDEPTI